MPEKNRFVIIAIKSGPALKEPSLAIAFVTTTCEQLRKIRKQLLEKSCNGYDVVVHSETLSTPDDDVEYVVEQFVRQLDL